MPREFKALLVAVLIIQIVHSYVLLTVQAQIADLEPTRHEPAPWWVWTGWVDW